MSDLLIIVAGVYAFGTFLTFVAGASEWSSMNDPKDSYYPWDTDEAIKKKKAENNKKRLAAQRTMRRCWTWPVMLYKIFRRILTWSPNE